MRKRASSQPGQREPGCSAHLYALVARSVGPNERIGTQRPLPYFPHSIAYPDLNALVLRERDNHVLKSTYNMKKVGIALAMALLLGPLSVWAQTGGSTGGSNKGSTTGTQSSSPQNNTRQANTSQTLGRGVPYNKDAEQKASSKKTNSASSSASTTSGSSSSAKGKSMTGSKNAGQGSTKQGSKTGGTSSGNSGNQ